MKFAGILLITFGILNIIFPDMLAYMLGIFFIIIGGTTLIGGYKFDAMKKGAQKYVKFGDYKIYR